MSEYDQTDQSDEQGKTNKLKPVNQYLHLVILGTFILTIFLCLLLGLKLDPIRISPILIPKKEITALLLLPVIISSIVTCAVVAAIRHDIAFTSIGIVVLLFVLPNILIGILLDCFSGWIAPFSNTVGYMISNQVHGYTLTSVNFKDEIKRYMFDPSIIFNAISESDLKLGEGDDDGANQIYGMLYDDNVRPDVRVDVRVENAKKAKKAAVIQSIKDFVVLKDKIAYGIWIFLITSLTSAITARVINDM